MNQLSGCRLPVPVWLDVLSARVCDFRPEQLDMPVANLSGGERARILIARAMAQPADVLILDEPTNDLDIPTLEVLEESLLDFPGALVLVTHDRLLMDRVATLLLGLGGQGGATFFADVAQWEETVASARPLFGLPVSAHNPRNTIRLKHLPSYQTI